MNTIHRRALTGLAVVALAACGAPSNDRAATVAAPTNPPVTAPVSTAPASSEATSPVTTNAKAATITTPAPVTTSAPVTEPAPADSLQTRATAAILRLEDLPAGWIATPPDDSTDDSSNEPDCTDKALTDAGLKFGSGSPGALAEASFQQSLFGPFIVASISTSDKAVTDTFMAALPGALVACDGVAAADGSVQHYLPADFPNLGDSTFAVRLQQTGGMAPVEMMLVLVRKGDLMIVTANAVLGGGADPVLLETATRTILDRL